MAKRDIEVVSGGLGLQVFAVEAGTTINVGEPVKVGGTGDNFVVPVADGDPEIATDRLVGIAYESGSATATENGEVRVTLVGQGTVLRGKATTPANVDTAAKIAALKNDMVTFDVTAGVITIDEDEGTDTDVHGLIILDGDAEDGTLDVMVHTGATIFGGLII